MKTAATLHDGRNLPKGSSGLTIGKIRIEAPRRSRPAGAHGGLDLAAIGPIEATSFRPRDTGARTAAPAHPGGSAAFVVKSLSAIGDRRRTTLAVAAALLGTSCAAAPPYDIQVKALRAKAGVYFLTAGGSRFADREAIAHSWHKRARALCPDGYDSIVNPPRIRSSGIAAGHRGGDRITGYVSCK